MPNTYHVGLSITIHNPDNIADYMMAYQAINATVMTESGIIVCEVTDSLIAGNRKSDNVQDMVFALRAALQAAFQLYSELAETLQNDPSLRETLASIEQMLEKERELAKKRAERGKQRDTNNGRNDRKTVADDMDIPEIPESKDGSK